MLKMVKCVALVPLTLLVLTASAVFASGPVGLSIPVSIGFNLTF